MYQIQKNHHCHLHHHRDDGEDDSDGFSEFDTSNLISSLMGNQSLDDYSISFEYTDEEGNLLTSNELRNPFNTNSQTVIAITV